MTKRHTTADSSAAFSLVVAPDRPLIGVVLTEDGREVVRYFADEAAAHAAISLQDLAEARALAGVWADLDWGDVVDQLDSIRHESEPTPPIEVL